MILRVGSLPLSGCIFYITRVIIFRVIITVLLMTWTRTSKLLNSTRTCRPLRKPCHKTYNRGSSSQSSFYYFVLEIIVCCQKLINKRVDSILITTPKGFLQFLGSDDPVAGTLCDWPLTHQDWATVGLTFDLSWDKVNRGVRSFLDGLLVGPGVLPNMIPGIAVIHTKLSGTQTM